MCGIQSFLYGHSSLSTRLRAYALCFVLVLSSLASVSGQSLPSSSTPSPSLSTTTSQKNLLETSIALGANLQTLKTLWQERESTITTLNDLFNKAQSSVLSSREALEQAQTSLTSASSTIITLQADLKDLKALNSDIVKQRDTAVNEATFWKGISTWGIPLGITVGIAGGITIGYFIFK